MMQHQQQPRWAEMCARILQQCVALRGGRENLAAYLGVHPQHLSPWLAGRSGPPQEVFDKAIDVIMEEHDRRSREEPLEPPQRRQSDR